MYNLIPDDMAQVEQKLAWLKANGFEEATKEEVLLKTTLEGVSAMFEDALEGPYWDITWQESDQVLNVTGIIGEILGQIKPREGFATFSEDFAANSILYWRNLSSQVATIVGGD